MLRLRHLVLLTLGLAAIGAFASPPASATPLPSCTPTEPQSVIGAHFSVNYNDDPTSTEYLSQSQAGDILGTAERAYDSYATSGFPTPAVGASGKTELYILDLSTWKLSAIYCTGSVVEDVTTVTGDQMEFSVSSDVFTQVERTVGSAQTWLMNGAAAWAAWRALGFPAQSIADIGPFDMSLDCDSAADKANCSTNGYENLGSSRWPFYEYLAERFGPLFIVDVFTAAQAAGGSGLTGLQVSLAAKGTTLAAEYGSFAAKLLAGGWSATTLNVATVPVAGAKIQTGISSGAIPTQSFGINHLSSKFVEITRGDGAGDHACYAATLTLKVKIPTGVTSQPTFYWAAGGSAPVTLAIAGNIGSATVPWDTCAWVTKGYLALPNTSLVDGTSFVVSGTLAVDFSTPLSSAVPPARAIPFGPVIDVSEFGTAPTLSLFGPGLLRLSTQDTRLRLIVDSSAEGLVNVSIGSTKLGTRPLRPGGNDLRFALPAGLIRTLRRTSSALVLTLTPVSPDSGTTGSPVTRNVSITQPAKKLHARRLVRAK